MDEKRQDKREKAEKETELSTEENKKVEKSHKEPIIYPLIATTIPMCVIVGFFIGNTLDKWLGTSPVFLIAFIVMGIIAAYRQLLKLVKKD